MFIINLCKTGKESQSIGVYGAVPHSEFAKTPSYITQTFLETILWNPDRKVQHNFNLREPLDIPVYLGAAF